MSYIPLELTTIIRAPFYSFFPVFLDNRNFVIRNLMQHKIFLAVHWPSFAKMNNISDHILSIPLDSRYSESEIKGICKLIVQ